MEQNKKGIFVVMIFFVFFLLFVLSDMNFFSLTEKVPFIRMNKLLSSAEYDRVENSARVFIALLNEVHNSIVTYEAIEVGFNN